MGRVKTISWVHASAMSLIAAIVSFFVFLLTQVIFGDVLSGILITDYESLKYININLILLTGLTFMLVVSFLLNTALFKEYSPISKLKVNIYALILTFIILFFTSWMAIVISYPELYFNLMASEQARLSLYFFTIFSIYVLPSPVYFWQVALVIYHAFLIVFMKLFLEKKPKSTKNQGTTKTKKKNAKKRKNKNKIKRRRYK